MSDLIRDKGKIRNCSSNHAKMSVLAIQREFYPYRKMLTDFPVRELFDSIVMLIQVPLWLVLFPVLPYIHAYLRKKNALLAAREVKEGME